MLLMVLLVEILKFVGKLFDAQKQFIENVGNKDSDSSAKAE